eukprot:3366237-Pyramimonas_sp.AAC.1
MAVACGAFGIELTDSVDLALHDENAFCPGLDATPSRPCGPRVCSRFPIGAPAGDTSTDISVIPSALLPLTARVAMYDGGIRS